MREQEEKRTPQDNSLSSSSFPTSPHQGGVKTPDATAAFLGEPHLRFFALGASRRGKAHAQKGRPCEDVFRLDTPSPKTWTGTAWMSVCVADGVGSAPAGLEGAELATRTFVGALSECFPSHRRASITLQAVMVQALLAVLRGLEAHAQTRQRPLSDFATTFLALIARELDSGGIEVALFQVGDGLVARTEPDNSLTPLLRPLDVDEEGAIRDLTQLNPEGIEEPARLVVEAWEEPPWGILLMTDGMSNDLLPLAQGGPVLVRALRQLPETPAAAAGLLELLSYDKRGSIDDRTLAGLFLRRFA